MAAAAVKLLGSWASPFVIRARIVLEMKGVKYEFLEEIVGKKSQLLLKYNPVYRKIPVLVHRGKPVCESLIIVEYVEEVWAATGKPRILPSDPVDRADARFWAHYIDDKWLPSVSEVLRGETEEAKLEAAKQAMAGMQLLEETLKKSSKGKAFFGGDAIGYLDIALGCALGWVKAAEKYASFKLLQETQTPILAAWADRFCADRVVKKVMPETNRLVEFAEMLRTEKLRLGRSLLEPEVDKHV